MARRKVMWLFKGLGRGGAERLLEISIPHFDRSLYDYEVAYLLPHKNDVVPALEQAGIPVFCAGVRSPLDLVGIYRLLRLLRRRRPDILHIHLPYTGILGRLVGRLAGVGNIVYTEHNVMEKYHPVTRLLNIATYPLNRTAIAVSGEVEHSMNRYWPSRRTDKTVIKNGIELEAASIPDEVLARTRASLGIPAGHKVVGNIAHVRPEKGHEYLVRAARLVIDRCPDVTFVVVGREKYSGEIDRMEGMAAGLGIKQNIIFTGFRQDAPVLLALFDIFVLSSLAEGLPLALLEAMVQGKPTVTTAVGGIPEVVRDGVDGFIVPPRSPEPLADKIITLLNDEKLRASMGQSARRAVRARYGIREMVGKIERVYAEILENHRK